MHTYVPVTGRTLVHFNYKLTQITLPLAALARRGGGTTTFFILQDMVSLLSTKYLFHPHHHFWLTPQPSLCLVIPEEDPPQLTLGQEMGKSSVIMPHTASPYNRMKSIKRGLERVSIIAYWLCLVDYLECTNTLSLIEPCLSWEMTASVLKVKVYDQFPL